LKLLLDTHLLLWASNGDDGGVGAMPATAAELIDDPANLLHFSPASIWEIAIKSGLGRADFSVDPHLLRRGLLDNGYVETPITSVHAAAVIGLPPIHRDPFDRMLIAQATVEGLVLLTADSRIAEYDGPIRSV
jgi:PIN domain nuclease of toxin-antitoxin system